MAGNITKTARQSTEKWQRNMKGAGQTIREGIDRVTEAPGVKAAAAQDKMLSNVTESITSGKWGRRVASVSLSEWKEKAITKGIPRLSAGVDGSVSKVENALGQIIDHADRGLDILDGMPSVTLEDNIQRMTAFIRHMATLEVSR